MLLPKRGWRGQSERQCRALSYASSMLLSGKDAAGKETTSSHRVRIVWQLEQSAKPFALTPQLPRKEMVLTGQPPGEQMNG